MKHTKAVDLMTTSVVTTTEDVLLTDAIDLMLQHRIGCLPVVDAEGEVQGIITEYDIMNFALSGDADTSTVGEAMSREVISFPPDTGFEALADCCLARRVHRIPIVDGGKVVGIVSRHDVLRAILELYRSH